MVTMQNNRSTQIDDIAPTKGKSAWDGIIIWPLALFNCPRCYKWAFSIVFSHVQIYNYWINFTFCWDDSCLCQFSILSNTLLISEWRKSLLPHQMLQVLSPKNLWSFSLKLYQPAPETEAQIGGRRKWGEQTKGSWSWFQNLASIKSAGFGSMGDWQPPTQHFTCKSLVIGEGTS